MKDKNYDLSKIFEEFKELDKIKQEKTYIKEIYEILEGYSNSLKELFGDEQTKVIIYEYKKSDFGGSYNYTFTLLKQFYRYELFIVEIYEKDNISIFKTSYPMNPGEYIIHFKTIDELYNIINKYLHNPEIVKILNKFIQKDND